MSGKRANAYPPRTPKYMTNVENATNRSSPVQVPCLVPGIVTFFVHYARTGDPVHLSIKDALDLIRDGEVRAKVEAIRNEENPMKRRALKEGLPIVCWSGRFAKRKESGMEEHSGVLCMDLDNMPSAKLAEERERLKADPITFALFTSPSGNGLKVLVRADVDKTNHRHVFRALVERIDSPYMDNSTGDPARACFLSWDPDLYVNEAAILFTPPFEGNGGVSIREDELDLIGSRVLARLFPEPEHPVKLLEKLLEQVERVDFRDRAGLTDEADRLGRRHLLVCTVEEVLAKARANRWDLCKNSAFVYVFNGAYWESFQKEELQTFLGEAAERMGVDRFDARHYVFMGQLVQQFLAQSHLPTPMPRPDVVLVNLRNGTFEISAAEQRLRPASPRDFLTYQLPFDHDPEAIAPTFQAYLDRVQPDQDRQLILAECVAYLFVSCSTLKLEKVPLLFGTGANGKSVFFDVVNALLGGGVNVSSFTLQQLTDDSGYFRAKIANKLVNYASEINGKMDAAIFKALASGEPVSGRLPYGEPFTVTRYAKLMFNCNELPREVEQTDAFFRRFLLVPFDVTIPEAEQDKGLSGKIIQDELSGVFNWVLGGLHRLLKQGRFTESRAVREALDQYRRRSDSVLGFVDDHSMRPSTIKNRPLKEIYSLYSTHCKETGSRPCALNTFSERLRNAGFSIDRRKIGRIVWVESDHMNEDVF